MMYLWEPDMIRFMVDASEHTDYNRRIAEELAQDLKPTDIVCDGGCGLAYLSDEMAPFVGQIDAIDINEHAVKTAQERISRQGPANVTVRCGDIFENKPEPLYDAMVFCFFGQIEDILRIAKRQCKPNGTAFVITRNYDSHRFSVASKPFGRGGGKDTETLLQESGIDAKRKDLTPEFGQPFRSIEDAVLFYKIYSRDENPEVITREFVESKLEKREDSGFPYYLPHGRKISIFTFRAGDLQGANT